MHALKFPLQSRECLDKDNINLRAVSLEWNRLSLSLSQTHVLSLSIPVTPFENEMKSVSSCIASQRSRCELRVHVC